MEDDFFGVRIDRIEGRIVPFQIIQQNDAGLGSLSVQGQWRHEINQGTVQLRIVRARDGAVAAPGCAWQDARQQDEDSWRHRFEAVPAGGLYRLEIRLLIDPAAPEWSPHGDTVHHFGVGDLWIIAGQSNAAGYGRGPVYDPPELGVHILRNNETWDLAAHPLNDTSGNHHPNLENANPGHSPYLRFAKELRAALGYPIGLVQTALGGSPLSAWNPVENPAAPLYHNLRHCVKLAGGRVRGMVWYQGESDCDPQRASTYQQRFAQFIERLRQDLNQPQLPVVIAQINRYTEPLDLANQRGWSMVREAQRQAVKLGHLAVVPTLDLPLSDAIHTSPDGNLTLGSRIARAALDLVYGHKGSCLVPQVTGAQLSADRKVVELAFAGVANRLNFLGPGEKDFVVEDGEGFVEVQIASCPSRDRVRLELARAVVEPVRVHGAFGANPASHLRDAEENMPMLGFYRLEVS